MKLYVYICDRFEGNLEYFMHLKHIIPICQAFLKNLFCILDGGCFSSHFKMVETFNEHTHTFGFNVRSTCLALFRFILDRDQFIGAKINVFISISFFESPEPFHVLYFFYRGVLC